MIQKIKNTIKKAIAWDRRKFDRIVKKEKLNLDFDLNKDALRVLETVFKEQEYAFCFPSQEKVTILDVGAHYGYFSFFAALNAAPGSPVFSLEPSPENFCVFSENLSKNKCSGIQALNCGLGAKTLETELFGGNSYNHSTLKQAGKEAIAKVQVYSLDDFLVKYKFGQVDFLKLDCEGAEYEILLNTSKESFAKIKTISLEFHDERLRAYTPEQLVRLLENNGFKIVKFQFDRDASGQGLQFGKIVATKA